MQIKVTFESTEEMEQFCRMITREKGDRPKLLELPEAGQEPAGGAPAQGCVPTAAPARAAVPVTTPVVPKTPAPAPTVSAPVPTPTPTAAAPVAAPVNAAVLPAGAVPTSEHSYTLDDLSRAAITLLDSGHQQAELQQLLAQFGVAALPMLPETQYGAFATALRGLGAKI